MGSEEGIKNLRPIYSKWKHTTTVPRRYPKLFIESLDAIAWWIDGHENPEEAIAQILEFIKDKG